MTRFARLEIGSIVGALPPPVPIGEARPSCDLFVAALGFEERCSALAGRLSPESKESRALIALYSTNLEDNEQQREPLSKALADVSRVAQYFPVARGEFLQALNQEILALDGTTRTRVFVDISAMTGSLILGVLRVVTSFVDVDLVIGHTKALEYGPSREEFRQSRQEPGDGSWGDEDDLVLAVDHGVSELRYSVDFQGSHVPGLDDLMVILPGFGQDRARAAIAFVNPAYLLAPDGHVKWMLGTPSEPRNAWRTEALVRTNHIPSRDVLCRISDSDYRDVVRALDVVYRRAQFKDNVTVVPLGTKMQTVGVALHCLLRPAVRVLVADPLRYRADAYSHGVGESMILEFGSVGALRALLRSVDSLVVQSDD